MLKATVVSCMIFAAVVGAAIAAMQSGARTGERTFPTNAGEAKRIADGVARLGTGEIKPFLWHVSAERGGPDKFPCFAIEVDGPLHEFRGHKLGGPERSDRECGLGPSPHARVVTMPMKGSDQWPAFDIGIAAYDQPVDEVRLMFSGDASKEVLTRHLGRDLSVPGLGALRYAVFAVEGCVSKVLGLEKGRVVASASDWECGSRI
jgi:hypothetical protein